MKPMNMTAGFVLSALLAWTGCASSDFHLGGFGRPVSAPVADADPTTQPASSDNVAEQADPAASQPAEDAELKKLETQFEQYASRFPATDLDRKIDGPAPATQPAASPAPKPAPVIAAPPAGASTASPSDPATAAGDSTAPPTVHAMAAVDLESTKADDASRPDAETDSPSPDIPSVQVLNVRPVSEPTAPASQPAPQANQPITPTATSDQESVAELIKHLEKHLADHPEQLDDQLKLRLLYLATDQADKAKQPCADLDPVQGEMLSALVETMSAAQKALRDPMGAASSALSAVGELQRVLSEQSPVVIAKLALVTSVRSFGDYREVKPARFPPGQPMHVFCYAELANFRSEPTPEGRLRTLLSAKLEIFNEAGQMIWEHAFPRIEDQVLSPRRDFFVPLEIKMDAAQPAGTYVLKVTVEDQLGATTDQQRMTFTIGN